MKINYNDRRFRPVSNTENAETSSDTVFHYQQEGSVLTAEYRGGQIVHGHLLGLVDDQGNIDMRYHQVNRQGELMTGKCHSRPEVMGNGKIKLLESWEWTSGDRSQGMSILEEI